MYIFIKLDRHVNHGEGMTLIDFWGQRSRSRWTLMTKCTGMLHFVLSGYHPVQYVSTSVHACVCYSLTLWTLKRLNHYICVNKRKGDMLTMKRGWTLLIWEVEGVKVIMDKYGNNLVNMREIKLLSIFWSNSPHVHDERMHLFDFQSQSKIQGHNGQKIETTL